MIACARTGQPYNRKEDDISLAFGNGIGVITARRDEIVRQLAKGPIRNWATMADTKGSHDMLTLDSA